MDGRDQLYSEFARLVQNYFKITDPVELDSERTAIEVYADEIRFHLTHEGC